MRRYEGILRVVMLAFVLLAVQASPAQAQTQQCFAETGFCISGRFAQYWTQNGGLAVFGYPLSAEQNEGGRTVQYFERQRFELHTENAAPYDVLLGRLGAEVLTSDGIDWTTQPTSPGPVAGCTWFEQTRHNVCDQQGSNGFRSYWQSHGLEFDGQAGTSYAESLALFGLPLTEPYQASVSGEAVQVQWFERARFEWHPGNPAAYRVLLGRLGAVVRPTPPAQNGFDSRNAPVDLLASFYNAINLRDYQRAYNYWENQPAPYDQFTQGYVNTASVQLIVQPPTFLGDAAGSTYANIPTAIVATQRDGSAQTFVGCYVARKSNVQPNGWFINQAGVAPVANNAALPPLLAQACAAYGPSESAQSQFTTQDTPVELMAAFYNAINRQEYQRAFGYWETAPASYDQFAQGYTNTASVQLIVQPPTFIGVGAGNAYASVPAVVIATQRDGSQQTFSGCYTTHKVNIQPDVWHISRAAVAPIANGAAVATLLRQACSE